MSNTSLGLQERYFKFWDIVSCPDPQFKPRGGFTLTKAIASGVKIEIHTRTADSRELSNQESVYEAIEMMEQTGIVVHTHKELNQRYAVVDESIVWYGGVDFLAFGRKDTDVLRFKNPDIAGEFLSLSGHAEGEQLVMEDVSM